LSSIVQHFGRPHTPTDQAPIESFFGHVKGEWPHLEHIRDPDELRRELEVVRAHYNTVRLHAGIGYVTPTTSTAAAVPRSAPPAAKAWSGLAAGASPTIASTARRPGRDDPACGLINRPSSVIESEAPHADVGNIAAFVASDRAGAMTGTVVQIDCGAVTVGL
jgi:hypothetical protein